MRLEMRGQDMLLGHCGVDSGQILLIDPCYVWDDNFDYLKEPTGKPYDTACRITLDKHYGEVEGGVVTSTLWGDGRYPVYGHVIDGRVDSVTIYFDIDPNVPDDDDEEDEDDSY